MSKWIFRILTFIVIIIVGLIVYVEINRESIVRQLVEEVNKSLTTPINYADSDVSLLRSFPHLQISLYEIQLKDSTSNESPLLDLSEFSVNLNLLDAIRNTKDISIQKLILKDGMVNIVSRKDNSNNYTLLKETESSSTSVEQPNITINKYQLSDINVNYIDEKAGNLYKLHQFNSDGTLKYLDGSVEVRSNLSGDISGGLLSDPLTISGEFGLDVNESFEEFDLNEGSFKINHLPIILSGKVSMIKDIIDYSMSFASPSTDIKQLLSLLPQVYRNDYGKIVSQGSFALKGTVSGNTSQSFPLYHFELNAKDGKFSYPDLPKAIDKISFNLTADNNNENTMYSQLKVTDLILKTGNSQLSGDINSNIVKGVHELMMDVKADMDLNDIYQSFKWTDITDLSGDIKGSLSMNSIFNDRNGEMKLDEQTLVADFALNNFLTKKSAKNNTISISNATLAGNKDKVSYTVNDFNYPGISGINLTGDLINPMSVLQIDGKLLGNANVKIKEIDYPAMMASSDSSVAESVYKIPDLSIDAVVEIDKVIYPPYSIQGIQSSGRISEKISELTYIIEALNEQRVEGTAQLTNLIQYGLNNDTLRGNVNITSQELILDKFISDEPVDTSLASEPIIPANLDLNIVYNVEKISYNKIDITKAIGDLSISNQKINIKNQARLFDGAIIFTGTFDDTNPNKRNINLGVEIKQISFAKTASQVKLFNSILPIAPYFQGEYNGTFNWKSDLTADYYPVLNTVTAFGEIETKNGGLTNFLPVDTILQFFNGKISKSEWKLSDVKRYFLIEDGRVIVKQIDLKKDDINVSFSGSHSFDQSVDYDMVISIPQGKLNIDKVYSFVANKLKLSDELRNLTNNVNVDLVLKVGGKFTKPKFDITDVRIRKGDVVESIKETAKENIQQAKDKVESTVKDTIAYYKNTIKDSLDVLKNKAEGKIDTVKGQVSDAVKTSKNEVDSTFNTMLDSLKAGNIDSVGNKIDDLFKGQQEKINILKDKLKTNILKKKDKN